MRPRTRDSSNIAERGKPIILNYRVKLFGECCDYGAIFERLSSDYQLISFHIIRACLLSKNTSAREAGAHPPVRPGSLWRIAPSGFKRVWHSSHAGERLTCVLCVIPRSTRVWQHLHQGWGRWGGTHSSLANTSEMLYTSRLISCVPVVPTAIRAAAVYLQTVWVSSWIALWREGLGTRQTQVSHHRSQAFPLSAELMEAVKWGRGSKWLKLKALNQKENRSGKRL